MKILKICAVLIWGLESGAALDPRAQSDNCLCY